jgi:hypothetical protein
VGDQKTNKQKGEAQKYKSYNLKKVGHTNNQKGIEKANNSSKENARKEAAAAAAAAANKIQIHSSWFTHPSNSSHSILHFYLQHTASVLKLCAAHLDKRERSSSQVLNTEDIWKKEEATVFFEQMTLRSKTSVLWPT